MDGFLALIKAQAIKYAVNSGIILTSGYASKQFSRLLCTIEDSDLYAQLHDLQRVLDEKFKVPPLEATPQLLLSRLTLLTKILAPAIDLVELK